MKKPEMINWADQFGASITVCDTSGIVVYMNELAMLQFDKAGGRSLVGQSLIDCHPEPARSKLIEMLSQPHENIYTIEKKGKRKIILQKPWMMDNRFCGVVELSIEIPSDMQHFVRK